MKLLRDTVTLNLLVQEGFAETPGQLLDLLTGRGDAVGVDEDGRLAVAEPVAARLRAEWAEQERLAAEEKARAEAARLEAVAVANEKRRVAAAKAERQRALNQRISRLETATGASYMQLEQELRRSITSAPNRGMSLDTLAALEETPFSLDDVENWVRETYGSEILEETK